MLPSLSGMASKANMIRSSNMLHVVGSIDLK
jgi:hypothetical protein